MKLSISGIGPDKKRTTLTWDKGRVEGDEFLKILYDRLGRGLKSSMLFNAPNAISPEPDYSLSASAFFYISRFIFKDVKIVEGSVAREDFIPKGAKA